MLIRKTALLSATCTSPLSSAQAISTTSSTWSQSGNTRQHVYRNEHRDYATLAADDHDSTGPEEHKWPQPHKGQKCPTPYQIFALKHNEAYRKSRFYDLVKQYHPDRQNPTSSSAVSHQVKIERYRLIVAANSILSDPTKRAAYDRFGAGWDGRAEVSAREDWRPGSAGRPGPFSQSWHDPADPVWQNATWEDWERYRERRDAEATGVRQERQGPLYMQNSYFVALIAMLAFMGGSANYNRAQDAGHYYIEQRDIVHDRAAKELRKVKRDVQGMGGREERIQWFLRNREATMGTAGADVETMREERADRLLPNRDVCRSEDIVERDT